jgi:ABC-type transporter Mla subunit MlaD
MSTEKKGVEFLVGLFLFAGLAAIAVMVVMFGRLGRALEESYQITVQFPNASGIVKGSEVLLSGASVGNVAELPQLASATYAVKVKLSIRADVKIPRTSFFQIRTSGLLGDSYVDVVTPKTFVPTDFAEPGEEIEGTRTTGFDDLTSKGSEMIDTLNRDILKKVSEELDALKLATGNINERLLSEKNLKNIEVTFENLSTVSKEFSATASKLDAIVAKTEGVVTSAGGTMKTIDNTANDLKGAIADFRKMADSATKTVDTAKGLMVRIDRGDGALGMLLSDRDTAENLRNLIANLRRSGILFYKDRPAPAAAPTPAPTLKRKTR